MEGSNIQEIIMALVIVVQNVYLICKKLFGKK